MKAIQAEDVTKIYRGKWGRKVRALTQLNLEISKGIVFGFIGPNGAGKSTTIKLLMGLIRPTRGIVRIGGYCSSDWKSRKLVGYLPENPRYYPYLTPLELLNMVIRLHGNSPRKPDKNRIHEILEQLNLEGVAKRRIGTFSKGMTQRLGLAAVLITDPSILILDEPMSGLDPVGRELVTGVLNSAKKQGKTIFFSSHILHDVERICDEIGVLFKGKLRFAGKTDTVLERGFKYYKIHLYPSKQYTHAKLYLDQNDIKYEVNQDGTFTALIPKEDLNKYLNIFIKDHWRIISLDPHRKSLQDIFVELLSP